MTNNKYADLHPLIFRIYAFLCIILAGIIYINGLPRSPEFILFMSVYFLLTLAVSFLKFSRAIPLILALAFFAGWLKTHYTEYDLNISAAVLALGLGIVILRSKFQIVTKIRWTHFAALIFSVLSLISGVMAILRYATFRILPAFEYHNISVNNFGLATNDLILSILGIITTLFVTFGYFYFASKFKLEDIPFLRTLLLCVWTLNLIAVLIQILFPELHFLRSDGIPLDERYNGIASFSYAMGSTAISTILLLPLLVYDNKLKSFIITSLIFILLVISAYFSGGRLPLLIAAGCFILWGIRLFFSKWIHTNLKTKVITGAVALAVLGILAIGWSMVEPENGTSLGRLKKYMSADGSLLGHFMKTRGHLYPVELDMFSNYPLSGIGLHTHHAEIYNFILGHHPDFKSTDHYSLTSNASNAYIGLALELGLPGIIVFILILNGILSFKQNRSQELSIFLKLAILVYAFGLIFEPIFLNAEGAGLFWFVAGSVFMTSQQNKPLESPSEKNKKSSQIPAYLILITILIYTSLQLIPLTSLHPAKLWKQLRWDVNFGNYPSEGTGFWWQKEATRLLGQQKYLIINWLTGTPEVDKTFNVDFFIMSELREKRISGYGQQYQTLIRFPEKPVKRKLLALKTDGDFVPKDLGLSEDSRRLAVRISDISMKSRITQWYGFFDWETDSEENDFRWSQQVSHLPLPQKDHWELELKPFLNEYANDQEVDLYCNGKYIKTLILLKGWQFVYLSKDEVIPDNDGERLLTFKASYATRPNEIFKNKDNRFLSFAIRKPAWLTPTDDE